MWAECPFGATCADFHPKTLFAVGIDCADMRHGADSVLHLCCSDRRCCWTFTYNTSGSPRNSAVTWSGRLPVNHRTTTPHLATRILKQCRALQQLSCARSVVGDRVETRRVCPDPKELRGLFLRAYFAVTLSAAICEDRFRVGHSGGQAARPPWFYRTSELTLRL